MSLLPSEWADRVAFDRAHVWHPFTQEKELVQDPPIPVIGAEGCDYLLADGRRVLDGISSWWCNVHGHAHPKLVGALGRQAARLDHVMFAGFTHEPALELVARLQPRLPQNLTRAFFSDNGSTAVEVALKMAFQAKLQTGEQHRVRFGALREGYHGDTLGALGVGELENWLTGIFRPLLLACDRTDVPEDPRRELNPDLIEWDLELETSRTRIRAFFEQHGARLAAFIAEPLVQGAGGMRFWPPELLQEIRSQCDNYGVYLILDEVMTGFGRTGTFLALDQCSVKPDFLCLSKGLTGGLLPLAMTWTTEAIYESFWGDFTEGKTFFHGHTFTANPMACSLANASLTLFDEEPVLARVQDLAATLRTAWKELAELPSIRHARTLGPIAACQIVDPTTKQPYPSEHRFGWKLHRQALDHGLLVRPMGDCLYLMPPLATPPERAQEAVAVLKKLLA